MLDLHLEIHQHTYLNMFQVTDSSESSNSPDFQFSGAGRNNSPWIVDDDDLTTNSPPLWKTCATSCADGVPLLPDGQPLRDLSARSVTQVIADYREEMMKMIRDLPESSYELSLRDIVDLEISQEAKVEPRSIEEEPRPAAKHQELVKQKKKSVKITRSDGMKTSSFLLKTFFPAFSISRRRFFVPENSSRIIPKSSSIVRRMKPDEKKNLTDRSVNEVASYNILSPDNNRHEDRKCEISCWSSFGDWKIKRWRKI